MFSKKKKHNFLNKRYNLFKKKARQLGAVLYRTALLQIARRMQLKKIKRFFKCKIYDCFKFYNELDLLEIRLNELDPHVDFFVIVEATKTHSGKKKSPSRFRGRRSYEVLCSVTIGAAIIVLKD